MDDGARTRDSRNHNPGLYQLSYVHHRLLLIDLARPAGIEPATAGLEGRCSIRLSYGRLINQQVTAPNVIFRPMLGCQANRLGSARGLYRSFSTFEERILPRSAVAGGIGFRRSVPDPNAGRASPREALRRRAHCIKIMLWGGVLSPADPFWMDHLGAQCIGGEV